MHQNLFLTQNINKSLILKSLSKLKLLNLNEKITALLVMIKQINDRGTLQRFHQMFGNFNLTLYKIKQNCF